MYSLGIKTLIVSCVFIGSVAFAEDHGGGHGGGGEEKKEEGGGHGEGGHGAEAPKPPKSSEASYAEVAAKVAALEAKVNSAKSEIEKLIEEKQHTKDPKRVNEIVTQMVTAHKQMQESAREYDQQRSLLKYRYPEKGTAGEKREYERIEVKTLNEMEDSLSLSSTVNRTMKKVRTQYVAPDVDKKAADDKSKNKNTNKKSEPDLTAPVILKK